MVALRIIGQASPLVASTAPPTQLGEGAGIVASKRSVSNVFNRGLP